jgi:hypothetical protein
VDESAHHALDERLAHQSGALQGSRTQHTRMYTYRYVCAFERATPDCVFTKISTKYYSTQY